MSTVYFENRCPYTDEILRQAAGVPVSPVRRLVGNLLLFAMACAAVFFLFAKFYPGAIIFGGGLVLELILERVLRRVSLCRGLRIVEKLSGGRPWALLHRFDEEQIVTELTGLEPPGSTLEEGAVSTPYAEVRSCLETAGYYFVFVAKKEAIVLDKQGFTVGAEGELPAFLQARNPAIKVRGVS